MLFKILWIVFLTAFVFVVGVNIGYLKTKENNKEIITQEIHLIIPKDEKDLKKQWLHINAQKSMLEEIIKWSEKSKILKEKEKKHGN